MRKASIFYALMLTSLFTTPVIAQGQPPGPVVSTTERAAKYGASKEFVEEFVQAQKDAIATQGLASEWMLLADNRGWNEVSYVFVAIKPQYARCFALFDDNAIKGKSEGHSELVYVNGPEGSSCYVGYASKAQHYAAAVRGPARQRYSKGASGWNYSEMGNGYNIGTYPGNFNRVDVLASSFSLPYYSNSPYSQALDNGYFYQGDSELAPSVLHGLYAVNMVPREGSGKSPHVCYFATPKGAWLEKGRSGHNDVVRPSAGIKVKLEGDILRLDSAQCDAEGYDLDASYGTMLLKVDGRPGKAYERGSIVWRWLFGVEAYQKPSNEGIRYFMNVPGGARAIEAVNAQLRQQNPDRDKVPGGGATESGEAIAPKEGGQVGSLFESLFGGWASQYLNRLPSWKGPANWGGLDGYLNSIQEWKKICTNMNNQVKRYEPYNDWTEAFSLDERNVIYRMFVPEEGSIKASGCRAFEPVVSSVGVVTSPFAFLKKYEKAAKGHYPSNLVYNFQQSSKYGASLNRLSNDAIVRTGEQIDKTVHTMVLIQLVLMSVRIFYVNYRRAIGGS